MVLIQLKGGLGNQMFQYSTAKILAQKNNCNILTDNSFFYFNTQKSIHTPRNFDLSVFNICGKEALSSDIQYFNKLSIKNKLYNHLGLNFPKTYVETSFKYNPHLLNLKSPVYLKGYFQSYKYFLGWEHLIKKTFSFSVDQIDKLNKDILFEIENSFSLSVHIRRGDYIQDETTQKFHGNCDVNYYQSAISILASKNPECKLFFFSDDIDWVKEQFSQLPYPKRFIDHNTDENSWKDMYLMSSCKNNIIANSSFSWWAAWLNNNKNKVVIAPLEWFATKDEKWDTKDLIPPNWVRI